MNFLLASAVLFPQIVLAQDNYNATKLKGLEACYPDWSGYFERSELISKATDEEKEYFLLYLYQPNTTDPDPLVISLPLKGGDCTEEFLSVTGDDIALSDALNDVNIGRKLTLGLYQKELENLGKEGLQDYINEVAQVNSHWHEEDIWALKQLGLSIPENVRAIEKDTPNTNF